MKKPAPLPRVSDHAVLRWLERHYGFDIEAERKRIDAIAGPAIQVGATRIKLEGVHFVIVNGRVVTTIEADNASRQRGRAQA